jgi:hypothetical protein
MITYHHQNAGQDHDIEILVVSKAFEELHNF